MAAPVPVPTPAEAEEELVDDPVDVNILNTTKSDTFLGSRLYAHQLRENWSKDDARTDFT